MLDVLFLCFVSEVSASSADSWFLLPTDFGCLCQYFDGFTTFWCRDPDAENDNETIRRKYETIPGDEKLGSVVLSSSPYV